MKGKKVEKSARETLLKAIDDSGTSVRICCEILLLSERRYYRWKKWKKPKERTAWNKTRPEEIAAMLVVAKGEAQADLRAAGLMVYDMKLVNTIVARQRCRKRLKTMH